MRIVQIIDSLEAGGAERMAVNYANALTDTIEFSGLMVTRSEGTLKKEINPKVNYCFLKRNRRFDLNAVLKAQQFCVTNRITLIHAHGSSFFISVMIKLIYPKIKIIWHDHYGNRVNQTKLNNKTLVLLSYFFNAVFVVSEPLLAWSALNLYCKKQFFIPNFIDVSQKLKSNLQLKGLNGKRIIHVANLKDPKNHVVVLKAFQSLGLNKFDWTLHLIGKDYHDNYSKVLKDFIADNNLKEHIFIYDAQPVNIELLAQANIGILSSENEGFPVTLLEYGEAKLAAITSNVGYCSKIVRHNASGLLFDPHDLEDLKNQLYILTSNADLIVDFGLTLHAEIHKRFSKEKIISNVINTYTLING